MRASTVCSAAGCPWPAVPGRRGRCAEHSLNRWAQRKERAAALAAARYRCRDCGRTAAVVHHLKQVATGGSDDASNLVALCSSCHARRHLG